MTSLSDTPKKKLGRPIGSKNKRKKTTAVAVKPTPFKRSDDEKQKLIERLVDENGYIKMKTLNQELNVRIEKLEHQAIGYRAVVSYLENQLGLQVSK